ncbi:ABC transporter permease [Kingella kingae]|uniref:ABC transporter permease n=1 Tax=Kingella kingae TaxID=504 RepID=UPI0004016A37|nr:ABC transporter permease [Kingella kingae]MDK4574439.1 ABC transporter permease [Kingella kingae]MDK4606558.1 ABC transporter permease [Kingella kingae]
MNFVGFYTLFRKEISRFTKVWLQTIGAPVLTALLYQLIFAQAMGKHVEVLPNVPYNAFLIPGLAMMTMTQNAFANTSSSLMQSRLTGNLTFLLLAPLSPFTMFVAYIGAAMVRAALVGLGVLLATAPFGLPLPENMLLGAAFVLSGSLFMGSFGLIAGIYSEKFDQLAAFQNFLIMPLTFLSGAFYSLHSLPAFWQTINRANPIFYLIDGFRFAFFGVSDVSPYLSLGVTWVFAIGMAAVAYGLLRSGWKLRNN